MKVDGTFEQVILPELPPGLRWNTEDLYTVGTITVVPESVPKAH